MKKLLSICLAAAVVLGVGLHQATAAEPKPIAAVAVASYDDLIGDINFVGGLVDRPNMGAAADGLVSLVTQFKGLVGIDKSRPWGAVVQSGGEENIACYVCVPVTDFKKALGLMETYNTVQADGGIYKLTAKDGNKVAYVKEQGNWACLSDKAEALAHVVANPLSGLSGVDKNYIVAGRVFLNNVPDRLREKFMSEVKEGFRREASNKKFDETDEQFAQRKKFIEQVEAYLVRVAGDLDQINFGWALDRSARKTYVDLSVTAKPGTQTEQEMALAGTARTFFSGFRPADAASVCAFAGLIPPAKQAIADSLIELVRGRAISNIEKQAPENRRAAAKELAGDTFDLLVKMVNSGRVDGVMTGLLETKSATGLGALYVADGPLFDKILHTLVKTIEEDHPEVSQLVKLDAEKLDGMNVHTISIPIPENAENRAIVSQYIGDKLDIVIAVGKENVYVAAGRDAAAKLKKAVEASTQSGPKTVAPVQVSYAARPIAAAVAASGGPQARPVAAMAEAELGTTPGEDHVNLTVKPISNGMQARLEVEPGLLRLAGRMVMMRMEGNNPPAKSGE